MKKVEAEHKAEVDYYRELASVSEERAREIRRIAAAHIRHASGNGFVTRVLRVFRTIAASGWRAEGEDRGPIWAARRR